MKNNNSKNANIFSKYTATVRQLLYPYYSELSSYFIESNIETLYIYDNWNGEIEFYNIKLLVPLQIYYALVNNNQLSEAEKKIKDCYDIVTKGEESIQINEVCISPFADNNISEIKEGNDRMWLPGFFRLFISHLSIDKDRASLLKDVLKQYGIDCFVAHEDINPSNDWEREIVNALFSMDALCAIVVPDFISSKWCDQEVGIALGQHKMVFSIATDAKPYGFFGRFQAINGLGKSRKDVADDLWKTLYSNEMTQDVYFDKLISLILNSKSETEASSLLDVLSEIDNVNLQYIHQLHNHFIENSFLIKKSNLEKLNAIFKKYNLEEISSVDLKHNQTTSIDDNLPF